MPPPSPHPTHQLKASSSDPPRIEVTHTSDDRSRTQPSATWIGSHLDSRGRYRPPGKETNLIDTGRNEGSATTSATSTPGAAGAPCPLSGNWLASHIPHHPSEAGAGGGRRGRQRSNAFAGRVEDLDGCRRSRRNPIVEIRAILGIRGAVVGLANGIPPSVEPRPLRAGPCGHDRRRR